MQAESHASGRGHPVRRPGGLYARRCGSSRDRATTKGGPGMGQRALVTGGGGFIGSNLARALLTESYAVRIIDDFSTGRRINVSGIAGEVELIEGDILDLELLKQAARGVSVVFHQAAIPSVARSVTDPERSHRVNVTGTLSVLTAARDAGVERVV